VDNSVSATAFKALAAPPAPGERDENETEKGLRVVDRGFMNTAVMQSEITYIDGARGSESRVPIRHLSSRLNACHSLQFFATGRKRVLAVTRIGP
jgi:hypothetical protein